MKKDERFDLVLSTGVREALTLEEIDDLWRLGVIDQETPVSISGARETRPLRLALPEVVGGRVVERSSRGAKTTVRLTTEQVSPWPVQEHVEVITAECVFGMNVFRDFFAGVRDFFGGRSGATQKVLRDLRRVVLDELRDEARQVGADAVVAVSLNYSEFSGGKSGMLFVVATGTAVKLKTETRA